MDLQFNVFSYYNIYESTPLETCREREEIENDTGSKSGSQDHRGNA